MPIALTISTLLLREVIRAVLVPWHLLLYLPQRTRWRRKAMAMLTRPDRPASAQAPADLAAGRPHRGHVFLSAGETSGESHAAKVLAAVRSTGVRLRCSAFGGPLLEQAGADLLYPLSDRAVMGFAGVLKSLPFVVRAVARFLRLLDEDPPDLVVLVDYPGLHLVLARLARKRGIPVVHYIAPQYWAWAPWRMHRYQRSFSATLTILPFEQGFFADAGIPSEYVGHPLLDQLPAVATDQQQPPMLCLLPGSRRKEITANLPGMIRVARRLRERHPDTKVVLPHVDPRRRDLIEAVLRQHGGEFVEFRVGPIATTLAAARVVLAKSGTGSLEACLHGTPTVVVYKLRGPFAAWASRNFLSVPWIASANLIAGREVIPEFCFRDEATWDRVADAVRELFEDTDRRAACVAGIAEVRQRLGEPGASARVARWITPFCEVSP